MSINLNYNKPIGKNEVYVPNFPKQADPMNRGYNMLSLPCKPITDPTIILPGPSNHRYLVPNFGSQRGSSKGLARTKEHPTNLSPLKPFEPYTNK